MRVTIRIFKDATELSRREFIVPTLVMLGRHSECEVHLDDDQASRSHARLTLGPESFILSDTSQNGTELEGGEVLHRGHRELPYGTRLRVGAYRVVVGEPRVAEAGAAGAIAEAPEATRAPPAPSPQLFGPTLVSGEEPPSATAPVTMAPEVQAMRLRLHAEIARDRELAAAIGPGAAPLKDVALRSRAILALKRAARELGVQARDALVAEVVAEAVGLGPLEPLLADPAVHEIEVLDPGAIYVVKAGHRERTEASFTDEERARTVLGRLLALGGVAPPSAGARIGGRLPPRAPRLRRNRPHQQG